MSSASQPLWTRRRVLLVSGGFLVCSLFGALFAAQLSLLYSLTQREPVSWWAAARFTLPAWYIWGLLAPVVAAAVRAGGALRPWGAARVHAGGMGICLGAHLVLVSTWLWATERLDPQPPAMSWLEIARFQFLAGVHVNALTYAGLAAGMALWAAAGLRRQRALHAARLEAELQEARHAALRAQLRPHFLFNTLNAIAALLRDQPTTAERMIVALSDLLRRALDPKRERVALREELFFARRYLEIEQMRFGARLQLVWDTPEETLDCCVPHLLLQPLVENAIRHGLAARAEGCRIEVSSTRTADEILLRVRDDGPGPRGTGESEGVGLRATRARLEELFGPRGRLSLRRDPRGGCVAEIRMPAEPVSAAEAMGEQCAP